MVVATAADLRENPGIKCDGDRGRGKGRNDVAGGKRVGAALMKLQSRGKRKKKWFRGRKFDPD